MLKMTNVVSGQVSGQGVQQSSTVQIISLLRDALCPVQGSYTRQRYPHKCSALLFLLSQPCVSTWCAYLCLLPRKFKRVYPPPKWLVVHHRLREQVPAFESPYLTLSYSKTSIDSWKHKHYVSANTSSCHTSYIKLIVKHR